MISTNAEYYLRPTSLEDALRLMKDHGSKGMLVGGGIDVALYGAPDTVALIDLSALGLDAIEQGPETLNIGGCVTLTELMEHPTSRELQDGILREVLRNVASPLLRNMATIAGAIASMRPWSDVIALLLALDARVVCHSPDAPQEYALAELLEARETLHTALITEIRLPLDARKVAFERFTRTGFDVGMLNCAFSILPDKDACSDVRAVYGGTPAIAHRLPGVEEAISGVQLTKETIDKAATIASETLDARDDLRASAEYRRELASVGTRRCLERIAQGWSRET